MMNNTANLISNPNFATKSWKNFKEGHKPTNSLIIEQQLQSRVPHPPHLIIVQPKNSPRVAPHYHQNNVSTIQRHYSDQDFRKYYYQRERGSTEALTTIPKPDQEYFPTTPTDKPDHRQRRKQSQTYSNKEYSTLQPPFQIRINHGLKQTSSTDSADHLMLTRTMPGFVKKLQPKTGATRHSQRLSTPRSGNLRENFRIISKLGEGKYGKVFMAKDLSTGFILAMKIVEKKRILKENFLDQFIRELKIQSFLDHPYIISLYGFFSDETHFYTLMQLGCDGQLFSLISTKKIITEQTISFIIKNLLEAIGYIHVNKVLHRDIKPQNIVLVMGNVKICDFGWAVNKMHPGQLRSTFCGTPLYLSPEILMGNRYDEKVDLWAIGILAFELYFGCSPFDVNDQTDLIKITTEQIEFPTNRQISGQFKQFINAMLTKSPQDRLSSRKLLEMDFITKYVGFQTCQELCK